MTVDRICSLIDGRLAAPGAACEIVGFYAGDFLSHVVQKNLSGYALLTVRDSENVALVACKLGIRAIILCDGVMPTDKLTAACKDRGIALIVTKLDTFGCVAAIAGSKDFNAR